MIKPATLWSMFKTCDNSEWLGQICRALGGQAVELDYGQQQMVKAIQMDSGWMDERIEEMRTKWRERQAAKRARDSERTAASVQSEHQIHPSQDCVEATACAHGEATEPVGGRTAVRTDTAAQEPIPTLGKGDPSSRMRAGLDGFKAAMESDPSGAILFSPEHDVVVACIYITGDGRSARRWRKACETLGEDVVRQELFSFYREIQSGEEPKNRGATFNARLKRLESRVSEQKRAGAA